MTRRTPWALVCFVLAGAGLLVGGPVASALTSEVRVVSDFTFTDVNTGTYVVDTGWSRWTAGTGAIEIGSAYGAPAGLGRHALMLDTPHPGDAGTVTALTDQPDYVGAFPTAIQASPDLRLGFWLYVSPLSAADSGPVLTGWIGNQGSGAGHGFTIATFDPLQNATVQPGTWAFVDATASDAVWNASNTYSDEPAQAMTWPELIEHTRGSFNGDDVFGWFEYGMGMEQNTPGTFSAVDGFTVSTNAWSSVTDFELQPTSGKPSLDRCKNNGWSDNFTTGTFKNQGACIASVTAART